MKGHFDLNAPEAELQKLVIAIDGPSKVDIQIQIVESGIYRVYYKCQLPGKLTTASTSITLIYLQANTIYH